MVSTAYSGRSAPIALAVLCMGCQALSQSSANDKARANSHDDDWEAEWVAHAKDLYTTADKVPGMVIHVGDSITHANPYGQWARYGQARTEEDLEIARWSWATAAFPQAQNDASQANGWYLAAADTSAQRGMTASGGLQAAELLSGSDNGGTAMPLSNDPHEARLIIADGAKYGGDLQITTLAAAFHEAQLAVVMLGTNDATARRPAESFHVDLAAIVDALEARRIVPILSTIPPHPQAGALAEAYNEGIRELARSRALPLIDFHAEILARRPDASWNGTLLAPGDVHPTAAGAGFNSSSDPYTPGGDPQTHTTGDACTSVGYLLRCWLTVQKLKEVKSLVVDAPSLSRRLPGDSNADGALDISDGVYVLEALFLGPLGRRDFPCGGTHQDERNVTILDGNGDGKVDLSDAVQLLVYLFLGGTPHARGEDCIEVEGCTDRCVG